MRQHFKSDLIYVWPDLHGKERGLAIEPFYPKQVAAAKKDDELYKLLALIDVIRVSRRREINVGRAGNTWRHSHSERMMNSSYCHLFRTIKPIDCLVVSRLTLN